MDNKNIFNLFILIIVGVVLLGVLANITKENTYSMGIVNETVNMINETYTYFNNDDIEEGTILAINSTSNTRIDLANFTIDYTNGRWLLNTDSSIGNNTNANVTYNYFTGNYIKDSTSRVITKQFTLFFVLAILLFVIGIVWSKMDWIGL
jgi:hypothetical protein